MLFEEVLQTIILVAGAIILLIIGMANVGGISALRQEYDLKCRLDSK